MRLVLLAMGSRGDVQPYIALSLGLQKAGHQVRLAAPALFEDLISQYDVDFHPLDVDTRQLMESEKAKSLIISDRNPLGFLLIYKDFADKLLGAMHGEFWEACQNSDGIIYSPFGVIAHFVAQKLGIPRFATALQPLGRTTEFPNIMLPGWLKLGGGFNYTSHLVAEQVLWQPIRRQVNEGLVNKLKIKPVRLTGPFVELYEERTPVLYGYSQLVSPPPHDWPTEHHVTGYWYLDAPHNWQPPQELADFLAAGPPPVYIGFGSMTHRSPEESTELILEALHLSGQRGVLLHGWGGMARTQMPSNVIMVESIPHQWLFPRMAAVAHHGGAGTTAASLRSGVPSIVVPHFADQPYWGERVVALGVGPRPRARSRLTPQKLADSIDQALSDQTMRERAAALGAALRAEDGVGNAVKVIERHLSRSLN
jgi:sterol 3beta-glucosyltransferase